MLVPREDDHSHVLPHPFEVQPQAARDQFTEIQVRPWHLDDDFIPAHATFQRQTQITAPGPEVAEEFHGAFLTANKRESTPIGLKRRPDL